MVGREAGKFPVDKEGCWCLPPPCSEREREIFSNKYTIVQMKTCMNSNSADEGLSGDKLQLYCR